MKTRVQINIARRRRRAPARNTAIAADPHVWAPDTGHAPILPLPRSAVPRDTVTLARFLLGKLLVRDTDDGRAVGRIVETEAYPPGDPAGHAFRGVTARNRSLFLDTGHAYVYLCYGTSHLLNVASEGRGTGAGVLLRALEPLAGIEHMRRARGVERLCDLARGPGRLCAALAVELGHDGLPLFTGGGPLWIGSDGGTVASIGESTRIGLTRGAEARLRYFVAGSRYLSGPRRLNARSA
jgi:DNA-3-methyladenine glycosylase